MASTFRRVSGIGLTALLTLGLASCGTAEEGDGTSGGTAGGGFPASIDSALGTAEIPEQPERVVTLGQGSAETSIALGVVPVGVESYEWGSDDTGYLPWIHEAVTEAGEELPTQFAGADDNSFVTASSIINPLTVPWVIERYVPMIEEAAANIEN